MAEGACKLAANGSVNQLPSGAALQYKDDSETDCCCGDVQPFECLTDTVVTRKLRSRGGPAPVQSQLHYDSGGAYVPVAYGGAGPNTGLPPAGFATTPRCYRLYVWDRIAVTGNSYGAIAPDYILKTNRVTEHRTAGVPDGPFETVQGSGIFLDDEPYWWSTCNRGGWEDVGSMWFSITAADIDARRSLTLADGTYTMLAQVWFRHWEEYVLDGGGDLVAVTDGQVVLKDVRHIRYV